MTTTNFAPLVGDTPERQIARLEAYITHLLRQNALLRSGIDIAGEYNAGAALGMAINQASLPPDTELGMPIV